MVRIPNIKIPSVRVVSIVPTSNIGTGGATSAPPTPITYLTRWKIVGNSEVHSLPYPDGVVLPNGYKRCEYLIFDGSSYINTGIKTANGVGVRTSFETTTYNKHVFGTRQRGTNYGIMFGFLGYQGSNNAISGYFSGVNIVTFNNSMYNGNKHSVQLDSENFIVDGVEYSITRNSETESSLNITIGALNYNGNIDDRIFVGNIYDTIIYNTQGELWHGIPCLDANDVPCFYDIISQTAFYNQGSGSFTYKLYLQPAEIWSCGEYNATDGKYHILVQPQGGSIADIALDEPLRKIGNTADTLKYPTETSGKALLTTRVEESGGELLPLDTPTTELVDAPQIEEAESYTCVISQGAKAVEWSSFTTNSE